MVHRAEHFVEVDDSVKEVPRRVADQRAQKPIHRIVCASTGPLDVREVFVALETEPAELGTSISVLVNLFDCSSQPLHLYF